MIRISALRLLGKIGDAEAALAALPDRSPGVLYELCRVRSAQGRKLEAQRACTESYEADPSDLRGLIFLVEARLAAGDKAGAVRVIEAARRVRTGTLDLCILLADTAVRAGDLDLAISAYLESLQFVESDASRKAGVLTRLGELQRRKGYVQTAIENLRLAHKLAPENPDATQNLALALDTAGDRVGAMALYEKTLESDSRNPIVLNNLAFHLAETGGDLDRALTYAQRALQTSPGNAEYLDTVGWIYLKKGLTDAAIEEFRRIVRLEPHHPGYRYHLAEAHVAKGDLMAARTELQKALELKPGREQSAAIRQLMRRLGVS
jgi:Flp pilus assembly protein TadD